MFNALNTLAEEYDTEVMRPSELEDALGNAMIDFADTEKGTEARNEARQQIYTAAKALELYAFKYGVRVGLQPVSDKIEEE